MGKNPTPKRDGKNVLEDRNKKDNHEEHHWSMKLQTLSNYWFEEPPLNRTWIGRED